MRKFFCMSAGLAVCAVTGFATAGEKSVTPQMLDNGIQVTPKRFARVSPDFKQTSPWIEVGDGGIAACPDMPLAFDCFEPDGGMPGYPTDGLYGEDCGEGGSRWYYGETYCNMFATNDMTLAAGFDGAASERAEWGWFWYVTGAGSSEQCYVFIFTAEDFDDTCTGPSSSNGYSGIVYDYGVLNSGSGAGYYFTDTQAQLCGSGLFHQLPMDGSGAYTMILANDYNSNTIFLATCGQPMLWGTKAGNPSSQGPIQWDDDSPSDGIHDIIECYDYTSGLCPDPLGLMACFYAEGGETSCFTLAIDNNFAGTPSKFTASGGLPNKQIGIFYSFTPFNLDNYITCYTSCRNGGGGLLGCAVQCLGNMFNNQITNAPADKFNSSGVYTKTVPIPCAAGGKTVYFYGFSLDASNEATCTSNELKVTFVPC